MGTVVRRIKQIQSQGYRFLKEVTDLHLALHFADDSKNNDCLTSLVLRPDNYVIVTTAKGERKPFEAYVSLDLDYAEILIHSGKNNEAIAKLRVEIDYLPARLIDFPSIEAIKEQPDLSIYNLRLDTGNLFVISRADLPVYLTQDNHGVLNRRFSAWMDDKDMQQSLDEAWESWKKEKV
jgi:hypothetical protein